MNPIQSESAVASMKRLKENVASNIDHVWNEDVAKELHANPAMVTARYPGWNFFGQVWWDGSQWACEVWQYRVIREIIKADSGEELMKEVSDRYGYD